MDYEVDYEFLEACEAMYERDRANINARLSRVIANSSLRAAIVQKFHDQHSAHMRHLRTRSELRAKEYRVMKEEAARGLSKPPRVTDTYVFNQAYLDETEAAMAAVLSNLDRWMQSASVDADVRQRLIDEMASVDGARLIELRLIEKLKELESWVSGHDTLLQIKQ